MESNRAPVSTQTATAMAAVSTVLICVGLWMWLYWPVQDWIHIPLVYEGDGLWNLFVIKTVLETGWYGSNPHLGAPFEAVFLDFAKPEILHLAFYRLAGFLTQQIALIHNLFYAAGFPLVALSALLVLRKAFGLGWWFAVCGAVLFTFIPYHLLRLQHLFLASYFAVPLAVWLVFGVASDKPLFMEKGRPGLSHWTTWGAMLVVASTSIYYAFFGLFLVAVVGVLEALRRSDWRHVASAVMVSGLLSGMVLVNLAPSLMHRYEEGRNPAVASRQFSEVEIYALRPLQMLLPTREHRSETFSSLAKRYESEALFVNENRASAIGMLAGLGLLASLVALLSGHRILREMPALGVAARANAAGLMLAMAGGAGALIALTVDPQFRVLNRISVFLAFLGIGAFFLVVQRVMESMWLGRSGLAWGMAATLLLMFGLWDQIPREVRPASAQIARQYLDDRAFARDIERTVPHGARILQWPHVSFPERPQWHQEGHYASLRGYLHSTHLRWSHGGVAGRTADLWHQALSGKPVHEQVELASQSGFQGLWLQRRAYADGAAGIEHELQATGLRPALENPDGTIVFYPLPRLGDSPVLLELPPQLGFGFYPWESHAQKRWAWTRGDASFVISTMPPAPREVRVVMGLRTLHRRRVNVVVDGKTVASVDLANEHEHTVTFNHRFTRLHHTVLLTTDVPAKPAGQGDPRPLAMALTFFEISDVP